MKIIVLADDNAWNELTAMDSNIVWVRAETVESLFTNADATAVFNLKPDAALIDYRKIQIPVFINAVTVRLKDVLAGENVIRINGWGGFLSRTSWEVSGTPGDLHKKVMEALKKKITLVPDEPGFVSARIIAMIINEAFFTKEEDISTMDEIDTAMKLGTNYPYGPFEWSRIIGLKNISELLLSLCKDDLRYKPSTLLLQQSQ